MSVWIVMEGVTEGDPPTLHVFTSALLAYTKARQIAAENAEGIVDLPEDPKAALDLFESTIDDYFVSVDEHQIEA